MILNSGDQMQTKFNPERFASGVSDASKSVPAYIPFGGGLVYASKSEDEHKLHLSPKYLMLLFKFSVMIRRRLEIKYLFHFEIQEDNGV